MEDTISIKLFQQLHFLFLINLLLLPQLFCQSEEYNLLGRPGEGYYIGVGIGTPPQNFKVLVDTGSTNFAIAASPSPSVDSFFNVSLSSTYVTQHRDVSVLYTQGYWKGELGSDILEFPSLGVPKIRCDIAAIQTSHNFYMNGSQWQGILGLAYPLIAKPDSKVLPWLESLSALNYSTLAFSMELCGAKDGNDTQTGKFRVLHSDDIPPPPVLKSPIIHEWFYELLLTKIEVGSETVNHPCQDLNTQRTIVDSGTTNLRLPEMVFTSVLRLLRAQVRLNLTEDFWRHQKVICRGQESDLRYFFPRLRLSLMETDHSYFTLELVPESYVRLVDVPDSSNCYKFGIQSSDTGAVLGAVVMQGFKVVFNRTDKTVGFMQTSCGPSVTIFGPVTVKEDLRKCSHRAAQTVSALTIVGYVISAIMCVVGVIVVYFLIKWLWESYLQRPDWSSISQSNLLSQE